MTPGTPLMLKILPKTTVDQKLYHSDLPVTTQGREALSESLSNQLQPITTYAVSAATRSHLEGANAGEDGLCAVAEHCDHGEPPVLQLLRLQLLQLALRPPQVEEVEELAACGSKACNKFRPAPTSTT